MKTSFLENISTFFRNRLVSNVLFWILFTAFWVYNRPVYHDYPQAIYFLFITVNFAIMVGLTYVNNLLLVPNLAARRRVWLYIFASIAVAYVFSILLMFSFKIMMHAYPKTHVGQVSFIVSMVSRELSLTSILSDAGNYVGFLAMWEYMWTMAWYIRDYSRQKKALESVQQKQVETELSFLKNQLNPHFLFNTLNNLYGLAILKSDSTAEAIQKLASLMRYMIYDSNVSLASFEKEKEAMLAYIELELLRMPEVSTFQFNISADSTRSIPPLLWLPVLENVFKHGTRIIGEEPKVDYHFIIRDRKLNIYSKNKFKAGSSETSRNEAGIGLENLRKRLILLFPGKYTFYSEAKDGWYITEIQIDLSNL